MSYDLVVFDPAAAPPEHDAFMVWYRAQTSWEETRAYDDPAVCMPNLRALVLDLVAQFPALNGPLSPREFHADESASADYSMGREVVYVAFAWSRAQQAYGVVRELAAKHAVGFFDVSGKDEQVWLPSKGGMVLAHSRQSQEASLILEVEDRAAIPNPTDEQIRSALGTLNSASPSFAILGSPDGSYVQCAGAADRLTVEWRTYSGSNFKHFVGGRSSNAVRALYSRGTTVIRTSASDVVVRNDQVLSQEDAEAVFLAFLHGEPLTGLLLWTDVTAQYA
jgi:hypothetical protein